MNKLWTYVLLAASFSMLLSGCSDKSSNEACLHKVTMDLDKGNYDAVVASGCADSMQRGAAYLGKAGFDITKVINNLSKTTDVSGTSGSSTSDFSVFMTALVGKVDDATFSNLDHSKTEYENIKSASPSYKDAQFYISLVDAVKGLSLIKSIIDVLGDGTLNNTCDMNSNSTPDSLDTAGCAMLIGSGYPVSQCTPAGTMQVITDSPNLTLSKPASSGTDTHLYRGITIRSSGTGTDTTCPVPNENQYLLVSQGTSTLYSVITTESGAPQCLGNDGSEWPCPILDANGNPIELFSAFDIAITSAIDAMNISLTSGATTTTNDVSQAITDIKTTACPSGTCTQADIANYLQTYSK